MVQVTSQELVEFMEQFRGGNVARRWRHPLNPALVGTDGVRSLVEKVGCSWLLDRVATEFVPLCLRAWRERGESSFGVRLSVEQGQGAIRLSGDETLGTWGVGGTDFPNGVWDLLALSVDQMTVPGVDVLVTTLRTEC